MKGQQYSIDELKKTFLDHAAEYDSARKNAIGRFRDENPDDSLPGYLEEDFNISRALATICHEIQLLHKRIPKDTRIQNMEYKDS